MKNEKESMIEEIIQQASSYHKRTLNENQKNKIVDLMFIEESSRGFIKIAVATIALLFTFNLISAQQYYKFEKKSIEQKVYSVYFESINQLP
jgi:CRISPR/Cas system Type II protein with McrA/HNH and RuvC-like nuclease domain